MATRLMRRVLPLAAMVMMMTASGLTLAGGFAQASVTGGAGPASGITGVAPAATPSQAPTTAPPRTRFSGTGIFPPSTSSKGLTLTSKKFWMGNNALLRFEIS